MESIQLCLFLLHAACMSWSMPIQTRGIHSSTEISTSSIDNELLADAKRSALLSKKFIDSYILSRMPELNLESKSYHLLKEMASVSSQYLSIQRRIQLYNDSDIDIGELQATSEVMKHSLQATCAYIKSLPDLEAYDCRPEVLLALKYRDAIVQFRSSLPVVNSDNANNLFYCDYLTEKVYCDDLIPDEVKQTIQSHLSDCPNKCKT